MNQDAFDQDAQFIPKVLLRKIPEGLLEGDYGVAGMSEYDKWDFEIRITDILRREAVDVVLTCLEIAKYDRLDETKAVVRDYRGDAVGGSQEKKEVCEIKIKEELSSIIWKYAKMERNAYWNYRKGSA